MRNKLDPRDELDTPRIVISKRVDARFDRGAVLDWSPDGRRWAIVSYHESAGAALAAWRTARTARYALNWRILAHALDCEA